VTKVTKVTQVGRCLVVLFALAAGLTCFGSLPASAATVAPYPTVTKVKLTDKKVDPGETIKASVKAENSALRSSRAIRLSFILSRTESPTGGKVLRTGTLPGISSEDDDKTEFTMSIPSSTAAGDYLLLVGHPRKHKSPSVLGTATLTVKPDGDGSEGGTGDTGGTTSPGSSDGKPASVLNLTNWKLTLPVGKNAHSATEVEQPALNSYQNATYFHLNRLGNGVVFRANAGGATTSGSTYPRSELREMTNRGKDEASWSSKSGTHVMTVTEAITAVPTVKPHVVAAQIHDAGDDVVMVRLENRRLFVEANGDDVGVLDPAYVLGTQFKVELRATSAGIRVTYNNSRAVNYAKSGSGFYFKAGCYTQSNTDRGDKPDAYGEVVIFGLTVQHF
jgi:poly(beta-D-mannuronate) lyase